MRRSALYLAIVLSLGSAACRREPAPPPPAQNVVLILIDVMPTVLELTGVATTAPMQGISLVPALRGEPLPRRTLYAEADFSGQLVAVRDGSHKFMTRARRGSRSLFDLAGDPGETRNLCDSSDCGKYASAVRSWQREMRAERDRRAASAPPTAVLDERAQERLRALGYEEEN